MLRPHLPLLWLAPAILPLAATVSTLTKGHSFLWCKGTRKTSVSPLPGEVEGLSSQKSPRGALALTAVPSAPARDFTLLHLKWGLKFLAGPGGRKWLSHSVMHLLMSSGWAGELGGDDRFGYLNPVLTFGIL